MNIPRIQADHSVPPAKARTAPAKAKPSQTGGEVFKPEQNEKLMNAIHAEPDARPEAVERARALVADPNYPSGEVLEKVADEFLKQNVRQ